MKANELKPGRTYHVPVEYRENWTTSGLLTVTIPTEWPADENDADVALGNLLDTQRSENCDNYGKDDGIESATLDGYGEVVVVQQPFEPGGQIEEALVYCPDCGLLYLPRCGVDDGASHDCEGS